MPFNDLLIHRLNTYDPNKDTARDEYNNPVLKLDPVNGKTALKCRLSQQISKQQGFSQSEVELIEEVPVSLFIGSSWSPTNSNYILGISISGTSGGETSGHTYYSDEEFYLIKNLDVKYGKSDIHHYEITVVPSSQFSTGDIQ
jgi:hypothetical protein